MIIKEGTIVKDEENEYIIEENIGGGGFGYVYRARNMKNNDVYAVKTVLSSFTNDGSYEAFRNEILMATKVESDYVIKYKFTHDGIKYSDLPPYIIMEYANQGSLSSILTEKRSKNAKFTNDELKGMFLQLAQGMRAINQVLVHRDIKPDNILIKDGKFKIADFGLSKIAGEQTRSLSFKGYGTIKYIAPEAWNNDKNTIQMDIYSMGIVFYELATLQYPYKVTNHMDVSQWKETHLYEVPAAVTMLNPDLNPKIASLIDKMIEKTVGKRFKEWDEIIGYLEDDSLVPNNLEKIVNNMVNIRVQVDNQHRSEEAEKLRKMKMVEDFCKKVKYQYNNDIYKELEKLIQAFNTQYPNGKIQIQDKMGHNLKNIVNIITLASGKQIGIELRAILEDDFIRIKKYREFGEEFSRKELQLPKLNERKILAWGRLYNPDETGFNLILLEKEEELYGEWVLMINTVSGLGRRIDRREPFGFRLDELEKEIQYVRVMHIYNSEIMPFNIDKFYEAIMTYI